MKTNGGMGEEKRGEEELEGREKGFWYKRWDGRGREVEECQQKSESCERGNESAHTHECVVRSLDDLWQQGRL